MCIVPFTSNVVVFCEDALYVSMTTTWNRFVRLVFSKREILFLPSYTTQLSSISMVSVPNADRITEERHQDETHTFLRRNDRSWWVQISTISTFLNLFLPSTVDDWRLVRSRNRRDLTNRIERVGVLSVLVTCPALCSLSSSSSSLELVLILLSALKSLSLLLSMMTVVYWTETLWRRNEAQFRFPATEADSTL